MKQIKKQIIEDNEKIIIESFNKIAKQLGIINEATIEDLQVKWDKFFPTATNEKQIQLVTDSQDTEQIHNMFPKSKKFDGFFVKIGEGEYDNIYGFIGSVPYLHKSIFKIK